LKREKEKTGKKEYQQLTKCVCLLDVYTWVSKKEAARYLVAAGWKKEKRLEVGEKDCQRVN